MSQVTAPRRIALDVLTRSRGGELVDRVFARAAESLPPRDQAWVQELVYGTLRARGRIDHQLAAFVHSGLDSLDPVVLDVLRLGAYQLFEMNSVPAYAAISQSVELVRSAGYPRAGGLVNGVLQALRRGADEVHFPALDDDPVDHLSTAGSHPRWLIERWVGRWGAEETSRLVEANNRRPELYIRPVGQGVETAVERLAAVGIDGESVPGFPDSVRILPPHSPVDALNAVPAVVQDPAAAMVVRYAGFPPGSCVVELGAAPGGKTAGLAADAAFVAATDLGLNRLRRVKANIERTGTADRVGLVVADGRTPPFRPGDAVMLDVPCSGTGTLRRHVDGRWRLGEQDLVALSALQRELLDGAASIVRRGGLLIYATCSLEPEENECQVDWFLENHREFRSVAPSAPIDGTMLRDGLLHVLPQHHGVDGAFAARFERTE